MRGGEGAPFGKGSPSPPRAPPLPSENFCQGHRRDDAARQPPAVSSVPRQHIRRIRSTTAKKSPPSGCAGAFFYEGEKEPLLEKGLPLPLSLPKTFVRVTDGMTRHDSLPPSPPSPGDMSEGYAVTRRTPVLRDIPAKNWGKYLTQVLPGKSALGKGWGAWGEGEPLPRRRRPKGGRRPCPLGDAGALRTSTATRGVPLPPNSSTSLIKRLYACSPARAARMRQTPQVSPEEVG